LSLDQRRRGGSFWSAMTLAPWPIRLLQVQLTLIYLFAVQAKLSEKTWVDGSALLYAWDTDGKWALISAPEWLSTNAVLLNAVTWAAILVELSIAVLVWVRRCRPWVLVIGVLLHLAMMLTLNVGFFSLAMYVLYLAFVPWTAVQSLPGKVKIRRLNAAHQKRILAFDGAPRHDPHSGGGTHTCADEENQDNHRWRSERQDTDT
nr:HTTM domain-containing protein [Actinomycetota bacterium]